MLELRQPRPLQQRLVHGDRLADLSLFAIQVAENHVDLERVGVERWRRCVSSSIARSIWLATGS